MKKKEFIPKGSNGMVYGQKACEKAAKANDHSRIARTYLEEFNLLNKKIEDWMLIMAGSPVVLFTISFVLFSIAEILFSWEMYRELLASTGNNPNWFTILLFGLIIVFAASYVSHLLSKIMSENLFDLEVYNLTLRGNFLEEEAKAYIERDRRKDLLWGVIGGVILLLVVAAISWQRSFLMSQLSEKDDISLVSKLIPILLTLLEIITGIYIGMYITPLLSAIYKRSKVGKKFQRNLILCNENDKTVNTLLNLAKEHAEVFTPTKEILDSVYRNRNRSLSSVYYCAPVISNQIEIIVVNSSNNQPIPFAHVVGYLPESDSIIGGITNSNGQMLLSWDTDESYLNKLVINNKAIKEGVFMKNTCVTVAIENKGSDFKLTA